MTPQELKAKEGQSLGTSEWVVMSQERINQFAEATGDHQFIHVNEEAAKMTPFGGTIAHGFLTLSMIPYLSANSDLPQGRRRQDGGQLRRQQNPLHLARSARASASAATGSWSSSRKSAPASGSRPTRSPSRSKARTSPR